MSEHLSREPVGPAALVQAAFYVFVFSIPFDLPKNPLPVELSSVTACGFLLATALHPSVCYRKIPGALCGWRRTFSSPPSHSGSTEGVTCRR